MDTHCITAARSPTCSNEWMAVMTDVGHEFQKDEMKSQLHLDIVMILLW